MNAAYQMVHCDREDVESVERQSWAGVSLAELGQMEPDTLDMVRRIVVSVEQFTSFRNYDWCPLGSLHKRLLDFDSGTTFQRSVEYLVENGAAEVNEYPNPQSDFFTKGILLVTNNPICRTILGERDAFIRLMLSLYERNMPISEQQVRQVDVAKEWDLSLWFSIMEAENVLNAIPGRAGQYSLFRTHHTVNLVAESLRAKP